MSNSLRSKCRKVNFNGVQLFSIARIHLFSNGSFKKMRKSKWFASINWTIEFN